MKKISSILILSLLLFGTNLTFAASEANSTYSNNYGNSLKEYDFETNSYNISDEQIQSNVSQSDLSTETLQNDRKASFWSKIVNSSHFSSNTATRTWMPLNKAE